MVNRFVKLTPKLCIMGKLLFECFVLAKPTKMKSVGPKNKCVSIFYIIFLFGISCQYTPKDTLLERIVIPYVCTIELLQIRIL